MIPIATKEYIFTHFSPEVNEERDEAQIKSKE
jgi:hypothetical protein